ncbi:MAG: tol-pal system protein YbgF, partial [Methylococcaceae bacterium]|nr:tol-pal system protein YbgF [Methylococcaceae bacterium]
ANAMYEVLGRLEQLQLEVQQLRGVVEDQSQTIVDLKKRQGNIYSDLDLRLQELSSKTGHLKSAEAGQKTPAAAVASVSPAVKQPVEVVKPVVVNESKVPSIVSEKDRYQTAYEMLRNGHNNRAIKQFKAIILASPKGEFADNSQYWLGEAYKVNQNLISAKEAFLKVVTDYVGSPKVPDALLKLGYIEFEMNNMAEARDYLTQITVAHPDTTAAHLATKKLKQMGDMQL